MKVSNDHELDNQDLSDHWFEAMREFRKDLFDEFTTQLGLEQSNAKQ